MKRIRKEQSSGGGMNAPDLEVMYELQEGEKKIESIVIGDNTTKFIINKEDHTVGNLLR